MAHARKSKKKAKKRGCGKRNWRRGPRARWKCKKGKRHTYARKSRARRPRVHYTGAHGEYSYVKRKSRKKSAAAKRKWKKSGLYKWLKSQGRI